MAVATRALAQVDRAQCDGDAPDGVLKVVYCPKDGAILGTPFYRCRLLAFKL